MRGPVGGQRQHRNRLCTRRLRIPVPPSQAAGPACPRKEIRLFLCRSPPAEEDSESCRTAHRSSRSPPPPPPNIHCHRAGRSSSREAGLAVVRLAAISVPHLRGRSRGVTHPHLGGDSRGRPCQSEQKAAPSARGAALGGPSESAREESRRQGRAAARLFRSDRPSRGPVTAPRAASRRRRRGRARRTRELRVAAAVVLSEFPGPGPLPRTSAAGRWQPRRPGPAAPRARASKLMGAGCRDTAARHRRREASLGHGPRAARQNATRCCRPTVPAVR